MAEIRQQRSWEYGPFVNWGSGLGNRTITSFCRRDLNWARCLRRWCTRVFLSGQFQYGGNIMPLWQAYTPPPHDEEYTCDNNQRAVRELPIADRRRNVLRREPDAGNFSLELCSHNHGSFSRGFRRQAD